MRLLVCLLALSSSSLTACVPGGTACTLEAIAGLVVTVEDAQGEPICDATVVAVDGDFEETLAPVGGEPCAYAGAHERAGTYRIEVGKEGFQTEVVEDVVVEDGECHVAPEQVAVVLAEQAGS